MRRGRSLVSAVPPPRETPRHCTGYSSLCVLQRFSVNRIKIGRAFVCALDDSGEVDALLAAIKRRA